MNNVLVIPQLKSFKNGEFSKYTRTFIELSQEQDLDAMKLSTYVDQLITDYEAFKMIYKKNRGSILTPELAQLDGFRDNGIKLLQRSIKLIADFAGDDHDRNQATLVYKVFTKHGKDIYDMAYNQQGGVMDEIIEEIETNTPLCDAIDNLNQRKHFNEMKTAHQKFDTIFKDRIKEQQHHQSDLSITELRKQTTASLREVLDWIFIHAKTKGVEQFETYIGHLNALTEQYNLSVERRLNDKKEVNQALNDDFDLS